MPGWFRRASGFPGARALPLVLPLVLACTLRAEAPDASLAEAYRARRPKTALDLQPYRSSTVTSIRTQDGREGIATLIDVNPEVRSWYLVRLEWIGGGDPEVFHLENARPDVQRVRLDPEYPSGVVVVTGAEERRCPLWRDPVQGELAAGRSAGSPYVAICGGKLFLRNQSLGKRTWRESAADFLRDRVWRGEQLTVFLRDTIYKDAFRVEGKEAGAASASGVTTGAGVPVGLPVGAAASSGVTTGAGTPAGVLAGAAAPAGVTTDAAPGALPPPVRLLPAARDRRLQVADLGLAAPRLPGDALRAGEWTPLTDLPGASVCALLPEMAESALTTDASYPLAPLDSVEARALAYLVAFDLERFELGYALGAEHPRVGWSEQAPPEARDASLPGPDGIGTVSPFARTGMVSPAIGARAVAFFVGGFKRQHGAFKHPPLSAVNGASHYGFVESGAVLSKLQPGLATVVVDAGGRVDLRTWQSRDDEHLSRVRFARQNGVPLVEPDPVTGLPGPGSMVTRRGAGNWSGSVEGNPRSVRGGIGLIEDGGRRFLVYGYFSTANPSAMARVFLACGSRYAMLLDMNALEHTYLAVHGRRDGKLLVQHLVTGMKDLDRQSGGQYLPRFLALPDSRDFFYLMQRGEP